MDNLNIGQFILNMVALVFSLSVHEAMHAWMSSRFGDDLARSQGRVSLNPITHVDPIGTLLFPAIGFFTGAAVLGWARPTPVNPLKWRDKDKANIWVSAAGVIGNAAIALVAAVLIRVLLAGGVLELVGTAKAAVASESEFAVGAVNLLYVFFTMNVGLAIFNLLPIPPLDGSKILGSLLPRSFESAFEAVERYGFVLLILALYTGVFSAIFRVVMPVAMRLLYLGAS